MLKKNREYLVLVPLIKKITKIESDLNTLKGVGESIQNKVQSIEALNTTDFLSRINKIIGLRNNALHRDLDAFKIAEALNECDIVLRIMEQHMYLHTMRDKVDLKFKKFKKFYKNTDIKLIEPIELKEDNSIAYLDSILKNDENRLLELDMYIKEYWKTKIAIPLAKGIAISGVVYYLWVKLYR